MRYYPILLDLKTKKCIVIGGGKVAQRKVSSLIKCGASVTVVSPQIIKGLAELAKKKKILLIKENYQKKFLKDAFLVVTATNNKAINLKVSQDAKDLKALVNVVDSCALSSFIVPAVLAKGDLVIAISTSAKAPFLSKRIKEDLKKYICSYPKSLNLLKDIRQELRIRYPDAKVRKSMLSRWIKHEYSNLRPES